MGVIAGHPKGDKALAPSPFVTVVVWRSRVDRYANVAPSVQKRNLSHAGHAPTRPVPGFLGVVGG